MDRYLTRQVKLDLERKMVFIGGARQVGKTTLARTILEIKEGYLNWDVDLDRERILLREWPRGPLLILDEIHKYKEWRNLLKGLYDDIHRKRQILVTGSARMDHYRRGGDSLQGRYHYLRLHPLSLAELKLKNQKSLLDLLHLGGFPEPFLSGSKKEARRWSKEYRSRLIREEIANLEQIQDLDKMHLLMLRLPELVGSPLSINNLREDLQINHQTASRWLTIFENIYAIIRISPFGSPKIRAVKKEQKHYHLDWSIIPTESVRFENMVAIHLLKWVDFESDVNGRELELRYFRDVDGREVDFVITENRKPIQLIECKWDDTSVDPSLLYLKERFPFCEAWQITAVGKKDYVNDKDINVAPASKFLSRLV